MRRAKAFVIDLGGACRLRSYCPPHHEIWRFQIPAQVIAKYVPTLVEYPPKQAGASFNIGGLREKVEQAIAAAKRAS